MTVLPFIASVVDAIKAETVVTKYFRLRTKGNVLQVQKENGIDTNGTDRREKKNKATEATLSIGLKEDYFFFVLLAGCSVLSAAGSSFSKAG